MAREKLNQMEAFEIYYVMGNSRTLDKVAEEIGKSARTLYEWSRKFNWQDRVEQRDIELAQEMQKETIHKVVNKKAKFRSMLDNVLDEFWKDFQNQEVKISNITDLEKVMKLYLTLLGEASEINKNENSQNISIEDRKMMKQIAETINEEMEMFDGEELEEELEEEEEIEEDDDFYYN